MNKRPPLGIPPKWITEEFRANTSDPFQLFLFDFKRFLSIVDARKRYNASNLAVPVEWILEQNVIKIKRLYSSIALN